MARINLLPWRAERRKQRLQEFYSMLGMAALAGALISLMIWLYYSGQIDGQNNRNRYLGEQIKIVDKQIAEIKELDKKKERLLRRKEVIEQLQASRSQMVHLFDELARTIADGARITAIKQSGQTLTLEGRAQSNARVSSYMRNLDASGWMGKSDLSIIEAKSGDKGLPYEFTLKVTLKNPSEEVAKAADAAAAAGTAAAAPDGAAPATTTPAAAPPAAAPPATTPAPTAPAAAPPPAAEGQAPAAKTEGAAQ